jgi:hypothetical protein
MSFAETIRRLTGYKAWANEITFLAVKSLPDGEAIKERKTRFKNMIYREHVTSLREKHDVEQGCR